MDKWQETKEEIESLCNENTGCEGCKTRIPGPHEYLCILSRGGYCIKAERRALQEKYDKIRKEYNRLLAITEAADLANRHNYALEEENKELQAKNDKLIDINHDWLKQNLELAEEIIELKAEVNWGSITDVKVNDEEYIPKEKYDKIKAELSVAKQKADIQSFQDKVSDNQIKRYRKEIVSMVEELEANQERQTQDRIKIVALEEQMDALDTDIDSLWQENEKLKKENKEWRKANGNLYVVQPAVQSWLNEKDAEIFILNKTIQEQVNRIIDMENALGLVPEYHSRMKEIMDECEVMIKD